MKYDADALHAQFGRKFRLVEHLTEEHRTPWQSAQPFVCCYCRVARA